MAPLCHAPVRPSIRCCVPRWLSGLSWKDLSEACLVRRTGWRPAWIVVRATKHPPVNTCHTPTASHDTHSFEEQTALTLPSKHPHRRTSSSWHCICVQHHLFAHRDDPSWRAGDHIAKSARCMAVVARCWSFCDLQCVMMTYCVSWVCWSAFQINV